jgi:hypothetical protein
MQNPLTVSTLCKQPMRLIQTNTAPHFEQNWQSETK